MSLSIFGGTSKDSKIISGNRYGSKIIRLSAERYALSFQIRWKRWQSIHITDLVM